jgi:hypothetical protein
MISCHNEIRDELIHMAGKAMTPSAIRDKPLIRTGRIAENIKACPTIGIDSKSPVKVIEETFFSEASGPGELIVLWKSV